MVLLMSGFTRTEHPPRSKRANPAKAAGMRGREESGRRGKLTFSLPEAIRGI
jgi:hypothetical protein